VSHPPVTARLHLSDLRATRPLIALWGGLAALDIGRVAGAPPLPQVAAITLLVAGCSYGAGRLVAACVAGIGWLLLNGFVAHQLGQLGFVGPGDGVRAVLLLGVALGVAEMGR
jgi:hypothetical protein